MTTLYILLSILTLVLGFIFGRSYRIVKRSQITDEMTDIIDDVKSSLTPTRARILSPRKLAEEKAFDKDLSDNIL